MLHSATQIRGYEPAAAVVARSADALVPVERIRISECARRHRKLENAGGGYTGDWNYNLAPYLERPTDCLDDDRYRRVVVMGPVQCGKSEVPNNWLLWSAIVSPANMVWLQVDKDLMQAYVKEKINPMIRLSEKMRAKQLATPSADNILAKEFQGMNVNFIWPVKGQMRMRSAPRYVIDDFDAVPEDIDGEGDPITLLEGRQTTFEGWEKGYITSSPALGFEAGIEAQVVPGTDERWHVRCPECGERFIIDMLEQLAFKHDGTPDDAEESATVICPRNDCRIAPRQKRELIDSGVWVARGQEVTPAGAVTGPSPQTDIASFRLDGLMGFTSWGRLARMWREAELTFERTQDERPLRAFVNTKAGQNYVSRADNAKPVTAGDLKMRAAVEEYRLGLVPAGVRFLTAAVDVQGNRFAVQVEGWGLNNEDWLIARFDIRAADPQGRIAVDPAHNAAHWDLLTDQVLFAVYPFANDPTRGLPIAAMAIDTGGIAGVTDNAKAYMHRLLKRAVEPWRVMLLKGSSNWRAAPLPQAPTFETDDAGKRRPDAVPIYVCGVHAVKDVIDTRVRVTAGAGYRHAPNDTPDSYFAEMCAERKDKKGLWEKTGPNESWDLSVYNELARQRLRPDRPEIDWSNPPAWARPISLQPANAVRHETAGAVMMPPAPPAATPARGIRGRVGR